MARTMAVVFVLALGVAWWCTRAGDAGVDELWAAPVAHAAERDDTRAMDLVPDGLDVTVRPVEPLDLDAVLERDAWSGSRARDGDATRARYAVNSSWRGKLAFASDDELPALARELVGQRHTYTLLQDLYRLGGEPVDVEDGPRLTRFQQRPEQVVPLVEQAMLASTGTARQALIMHLAMALPVHEARERLQPLLDGDDPDDAEDALCALAFQGEAAALNAFETLARTPAPVDVSDRAPYREDLDALVRQGARGVLRSYRCIEVLRRSPYFHMDGLAFHDMRGRYPWAAPGDTGADASVRLLEAWLARYPGHAGADNACYRLAQLHLRAGRHVDALHAASRGSVEEDGDAADRCLHLLIALLEQADLRSDVFVRRLDVRAPRRNADLLHYVWVRRLADEVGVQAGLDELARIAQREPELRISLAWRRRWSGAAPRALDSGLVPIPDDDPLRRVEPNTENGRLPSYRVEHTGWWRHDPAMDRERIALDVRRLTGQFRAWETLAGFERRARTAPYEERVDWLYKQAALHYHDRNVFYPVYASHHRWRSGRADGLERWDDVARDPPPVLRYAPEYGYGRAIAGFRRVLSEGPGHPLADDALFSIGMAHVKLASWPTVRHDHDLRRAHLDHGVQVFERLAREFPHSHLSDDGANAAAHWRRLGYGGG